MATSPNLRACAMALALLLLSGCASAPSRPANCPPPAQPPADLMQEPRPEGWFRQRLLEILAGISDPS